MSSIFPKDANTEVLVNDLLTDSFFAHLNLEFLQCFINEGHLFWMVWLCYGLADYVFLKDVERTNEILSFS